MGFDGGETFSADHMLDAAGILSGSLRIDARLGQIDEAGIRYGNLVFLAKILHSDADTGFLKAKFIGNINGSYDR